ncbi:MAG TPA: hypothetical protein VHA52_13145 [Candidatus Babeliaceae bacterium]|nr:hypothetical protein [Candidatus Babeliaceae bacterium]
MTADLHKWVTDRKFTILDTQAKTIRRIFLKQSTALPTATDFTIQDFNDVERAIDSAASLLYISMRNYQLHEVRQDTYSL